MSSQHHDTGTRHTADHVLCPGLVQCSDNLPLSGGGQPLVVTRSMAAGCRSRAVASVHDNVIVRDSRDTGELTAASCVQCTVLYSAVQCS